MSEDDARAWISQRWGDGAVQRLKRFADMVTVEATRQNLVSPASLEALWTRHIVDSAQLLLLATDASGLWVDIGTGAGFPGIVAAVLRDAPLAMIEPRRLRADFLSRVVTGLNLGNAVVYPQKAELAPVRGASVVSARAVAPLSKLFDLSILLGKPDVVGIFPRGRTGRDELRDCANEWKGVFHVEQSVTQPDATIVLATDLDRR